MGRLGMAARQLREIAEVLEREDSRQESLLFYEQAADLFATDNSTAEANKCLLKVAQFSAETDNFPRAIDIYETVAKAAVDNNLLRFSAKGHLLHAGLCALCAMDPAGVRDRIERYKDLDLNFDGSREAKLLETLVDSTENGDVETFTDAVAEFDSLTRLDAFKTALLVSVKEESIERERERRIISYLCVAWDVSLFIYISFIKPYSSLQLRAKRRFTERPDEVEEEDLT